MTFLFYLFAFVPLIAHVVWCVAVSAWVLMVAGVLVTPVGWVHGLSILLGFGGWG